MTTGTPLPAFEHDPLPEHTSHFRLLHIIRGDFGQHVECEISAWPIDNAPPYYAISYTWGDPADTTEITVNGRSLIVRRNCEYVLQQAFASKTSKYFWVDAICIVQTTDEKNHQVGIMGQIYSGAKHVLACVGPHENDSEFLPKIIKKYPSLLKSIAGQSTIDGLGDPWWHPSVYNPIQKRNRLLFRCLLHMKSRIRHRLYRSFCFFMMRSYFKRLWIIQELHLARRVSYCFGEAVETAEHFLALYRLLDIWNNRIYDSSPGELVLPLVFFVRHTVAYSRTKASQAMESTMKGLGNPPSLLYFACSTAKGNVQDILLDPDLQCADPRDRLFGILSVLGQVAEGIPKADYTKDRFEVAVEAFKFMGGRYRYDDFSRALQLCRNFQVTGEEGSLHNALALRSSTSQAKAMSDHLDSSRFRFSDYNWQGIKISRDVEDLALSVTVSDRDFRTYVSAREHEGCCSLHFKGCPETISISAPSSTRHGDWWLLPYYGDSKKTHLGFVVRKSEGGKYNVIGQTHQVDFDYAIWRAAVLRYGCKSFTGYWYPEDYLILGWVVNELEAQDVTQDRIREYVNRVICAWDGSSFFWGTL